MKDTIEIPLSKTKIILLLMGAMAFVIAGILFLITPETFITLFRGTATVQAAGIASIVFFGLCLFFLARKLFDNKPGLVIDRHGIIDNTSAFNVGLVEWTDITGIEVLQIASTKLMMVHTDKPDKYIARAKSALARRLMKTNHNMYGSPLSITASSLKIKFSDLERLLSAELNKRKTPSNI